MKKSKTICKSIVIADFIQSPIIEIAGEVTFNLASDNSPVEILIVDDYFPSECFSRRLPKFFKWFDIPQSFIRVLNKNPLSKVKCRYRNILRNYPFEKWPKSLKEIFQKISKNETNSINNILKNFKFNDVYIGVGILSSIISLTKDNYPNYALHKKEIEKVFIEFNRRYMFYVEFFSQEKNYDKCFIFNGRFASNKALLSALSILNLDLKIFYMKDRKF